MGVDKKQYRQNYYITHKEYFKKRNSTDEKKAYYKEYYQKNKHIMKFKKKNLSIVKTIVKEIKDKIIVRFD